MEKNDDIVLERCAIAERKAEKAMEEASKYRMLWEASASCISANKKKIKPRGEDERRLIDIAESANHGLFWSGKTDGWINEANNIAAGQ